MFRKMKLTANKLFTCLFITTFFLILFNGCSTNLKINAKVENGENIIIEQNLDQSFFSELSKLEKGAKIAELKFTKTNFILWTNYNYQAVLGNVLEKDTHLPENFNLIFSLNFPGKVIKTNANYVKNNQAKWKINKTKKIFLSSKKFNFEYIFTILGIIFIVWIKTKHSHQKI